MCNARFNRAVEAAFAVVSLSLVALYLAQSAL